MSGKCSQVCMNVICLVGFFDRKSKTVNNKEAKLNTVNTWNQNNTTCFTPSNYFDCVVYWFKDFYPPVAGVRQVFCNVLFSICNSLYTKQFAHFQQFLKAVTLLFCDVRVIMIRCPSSLRMSECDENLQKTDIWGLLFGLSAIQHMVVCWSSELQRHLHLGTFCHVF